MTVYNPFYERTVTVRAKVPNTNFSLVDMNNNQVEGDVICANRTDSTDCDLYFVDNFKGYALQYYKLVPNAA